MPLKRNLGIRIASAAVLVPIALAALYLGTPWFGLLAALAAMGMAWEWARLTGWSRTVLDGTAPMAIAGGAVALAAAAHPALAAALAAAAAGGLIYAGRAGSPARPAPLWTGCGLLWIVLPVIAIVALRDGPLGFATTFWLLALVWAVDTAAYAAGKSLGGPRLAPRISPSKTWSGLFGGMLGAALAGLVTAALVDGASFRVLVLASAGLAIVEQIGDIAESYAKRRFGVKDSSSLIPGHGGLLDRLDGMLAVIAAVVVLQLVGGGSILEWR